MSLNGTDKGDKDTQASECVSGLTTARRRSGGDVLVRGGVLPESYTGPKAVMLRWARKLKTSGLFSK